MDPVYNESVLQHLQTLNETVHSVGLFVIVASVALFAYVIFRIARGR